MSEPGKSAPPAIDRSVLGEWLGGDDVAIDELLAVFGDSVRSEAERMHDLLAAGDLAELAKAAHRLRGAALSMGARRLAAAAAAMDAAAQANDPAACAAGFPDMRARVRLTLAEVPGRP